MCTRLICRMLVVCTRMYMYRVLIVCPYVTRSTRVIVDFALAFDKAFRQGLRSIDSLGVFYETKTPLISHLFALCNAIAGFLNCLCLNGH